MRVKFLLFVLFYIKYSFADLEDLVLNWCGCLENECCTLDEIDLSVTNNINTGSASDWVQTVDYGNFTSSFSIVNVPKNIIGFYSAEDNINCSHGHGILYEQGTNNNPILMQTLKQLDNSSCAFNYSNVLTPENLAKTLDLVLAFGGDLSDISFDLLLLEPVLPYASDDNSTAIIETKNVRLSSCSIDDTNSRSLLPIAHLLFDVEVETRYGRDVVSVVVKDARIDDILLEQVGSIQYSDLPDNNEKVLITLRTKECIYVDTNHSDLPKTASNLISCHVSYLPHASVSLDIVHDDGFIEKRMLDDKHSNVSFNASVNPSTQCGDLVVELNNEQYYTGYLHISDVERSNSGYPLQSFGEDAIFDDYEDNMILDIDKDIVVKLVLQDDNDEDNFHVIIEDILVTLETMEETQSSMYKRYYSKEHKTMFMQNVTSPYFQDGHFCRKFQTDDETCGAFYQRVGDSQFWPITRWNEYLEQTYDLGISGKFAVDGKTYEGCPDIQEKHEDAFVFKPSNWIFKNMPAREGIMTITATAYLRPCVTNTRRVLQQEIRNQQTLILTKSVFVTSSLPSSTEPPTLPPVGGAPDGADDDNGFMVATIILAVLLGLILLYWILKQLRITAKIYSAAQEKLEQMT